MSFNATTSGATANSYSSVADANAFHTDRANAVWADIATDDKEVALIKATDYIDANYVFRSVKATDEQALECPRYPDDILDQSLVKATALLALHMLTVDANALVTARSVTKEDKSLDGVGSTSVTYDNTRTLDPFPFVTKMMSKIASRSGAGGGTIWLRQ